ncbi:diguanylate cyclase [Agarivorans sp. Z349TD_8]|uniref:diguanylate cyclase n=1 Tax=Agarivorans sp. Z349TD_8 TaxID=3421434 RepID=UPI003D7D90BF
MPNKVSQVINKRTKPNVVKLGLGAALLAFFSLAILAIVFTALNNVDREIKNKVKKSLLTTLHTTQQAQHIWLQHRLTELDNITRSQSLRSIAQTFTRSKPSPSQFAKAEQQLAQSLRFIMESYQDQNYWLTRRNGQILSSNLTQQATRHPLFELSSQAIQEVLAGETRFITGSAKTEHDTQSHIYFCSPVFDEQRQVIAVLIIGADQHKHFNTITQLGNIWDSGATYAFDQNGVMLSNSRSDEQLHRVGLLAPAQSAINTIRITDPGSNILERRDQKLSKLPLTLMAQSATRGQTDFNIEGYRDYRGILVLGAWSWQANYGFGLATEIDKSEAYNVYGRTKNIVLIGIISSLVVTFSLFMLLYISLRNGKRSLYQAQLVLEDRVKQRTANLEAAQQQLRAAYQELEQVSITDSLTGIPNRRCADTFLNSEWRRAQRDGYPITIMLIDIDHFKQYNDHYGHPAGDICLELVARTLIDSQICKRPGDLIARYGGEEFIAILSNSDQQYATLAANNLLEAIRKAAIPHNFTLVEDQTMLTISIGVSIAENIDTSLEKVVSLADQALYISKQTGRNRYHLKLPQ